MPWPALLHCPDHEQHDQTECLGRGQPVSRAEADAHPRRVAAHEGDEQAAEVQEANPST
jgi:hypothetical protein